MPSAEQKNILKKVLPGFVIRFLQLLKRLPVDVKDAVIIFACKQPSHTVRLWILRICGLTIGTNSSIHMGCRLYHPWNIVIGDHTVINPFCLLDGRTGLHIGDNVSISERSLILSLEHDPQSPDFAHRRGITKIGDYAWLGMNATILPGITIGKGAVVAAGAVVTKDAGEYEIVGGVPARKIGTRTKDLRYVLDYRKLFH